MCDMYGDIETNGLLLDCTVMVSRFGQVGSDFDTTHTEVKGVYECVGCLAKDVLGLIGHERESIAKFIMNDNYIPYNSELFKEYNLLVPRPPGCYLVKENDQLCAVVIDEFNEANIIGVVSSVVPFTENGVKQNVVMIGPNGLVEMTSTTNINMDKIVLETNAKLGVVSLDGFLIVRSDINCTNLTLILQHGYFILHDGAVVWTRKSVEPEINTEIDDTADQFVKCKTTKLQSNEIFVTTGGAIMPKDSSVNEMTLISSHNAIVDYNAFKQCIACLDRNRREDESN